MNQNFIQRMITLLLIICFLTAGCSQAVPSNSMSANDTQPISEQQIVIKTESSSADNAENTQVSEAAETSALAETAAATPIDENTPNKGNASQAELNDIRVLNGYTMIDGMDTPVQIKFQMTSIKRGDTAYEALSANQPNLSAAEPGMEYIIITFNVNYESGGADMLVFEQSNASLDAARLSFYLSNGDSNAEQLTNLLADNIYNLSLNKGSSGTGSVAFLHKADGTEPLRFIGFGSTLDFSINQ